MPIQGYGVLVGTAIATKAEADQQSPHYQIHLLSGDVHYRVAVNVRSAQNPPDLLYLADEGFDHPILGNLAGLEVGFHQLPSAPGGSALDYIRANLFDRADLKTLPSNLPGPDNDLSDKIDHYLSRAVADPQAVLYAFGQRWGPEPTTPDKIFGFTPGNGIHDIHMNQGNSGPFVGDDGVWQDGALLINYPSQSQWVAFFLAFQSQSWHTDDTTGHAVPHIEPGPSPSDQDRRVRIVGALVNPPGPAPEQEVVTILNCSPQPIHLTGWTLADRLKRGSALPAETLPAGAAMPVVIQPPTALGNSGGLITLLDPEGLKVDGVSYTAADAVEGWTVAF